ncbi:MAG: hypothetical protein VZR02_04080 [Lachnospiraceae bacterium]|nr:hypothetical protein [Lachnospiraceae bacterium]
MAMSFADMLNSMIDRLPISKNELIRETGINRSTFFKFLKGDRLPTGAQMMTIVETAGFPAEETTRLRKAFEREHYGYMSYRSIELVRQFMESAVESTDILHLPAADDSGEEEELETRYEGTADVRRGMLHFLKKARRGSVPPIFAFLPLEEAYYVATSRVLAPGGREVHFLFSFPDTLDDLDSHVAPYVRYLLPIVFSPDCQVNYYYSMSDLAQGTGILYPYYILTEDEAFFIDAETSSAYVTCAPELVDILRQTFKKRLPFTEEILHPHKTLAETQAEILSLVKENGICMFGPTPCLSLLATEDLARAYMPPQMQDALISYFTGLQASNPIEVISADGLRKMVEENGISEIGIHVTMPRPVMHQALLALKARLGTSLFIADSKKITIPAGWSVNVIPDNAVYLVPYIESFDTVIIREKNLVEAFTQVFDMSLDFFTFDTPASERLLDYYIDATGA